MSYYPKNAIRTGILTLHLLLVAACSSTTSTPDYPVVNDMPKNKQESRLNDSAVTSETLKAIEAISESQLDTPYKTLTNKALARFGLLVGRSALSPRFHAPP